MFKNFPFEADLRAILIFVLCILLLVSSSNGQSKADLEVQVQTAAETARGGESFSYTVTIRNIGTAKASDVGLINTPEYLIEILSGASSKGSCEKNEYQMKSWLRCMVGEMNVGETVTILVKAKIQDFGDSSEPEGIYGNNSTYLGPVNVPGSINKSRMAELAKNPSSPLPPKIESRQSSLGELWVSSDESEEYPDNNLTQIRANLLPSINIPPRVEILSPAPDAVITRPAKKMTKVVFTIKAFDPDGTIEKVIVNTQQFGMSVEYPENRIVIEGKSYSIKEVEDNKDKFEKYFGGEATRSGKDTYTFTLENPRYGFSTIYVNAIDNGKRVGFTSLRLTVKGDNSIEFIKPLKNSIIQPNTDVLIETRTKLNEATSAKLELTGSLLCCGAPPIMKQISKIGNVYTHQYLWKNILKGYYSFQIILTEDSGAFTYSESFEFKVTEKPRVKITSIKNGQAFKEGDEIPIDVEALDPDGEITNVSIPVNGKYDRDFSWRQNGYKKSGYISGLRKGIHTVHAKVTDDMDVEVESEPITFVIK